MPEQTTAPLCVNPLADFPVRVMRYTDIKAFTRRGDMSLLPAIDPGPLSGRPYPVPVSCCLGVRRDSAPASDSALLQAGLADSDFVLCGDGLAYDTVDIDKILSCWQPQLLFIQDRAEWLNNPETLAFEHIDHAAQMDNVLRATVVDDVGVDPVTQHWRHSELRPHLYVTYNHSAAVSLLAPWIPAARQIRTYHCLDKAVLPKISRKHRAGAAIVGKFDRWLYPLRYATVSWPVSGWEQHQRSAYGNLADYLREIAEYKVCLATAGRFGFAVREIIEAVACGCTPVTTLPFEDVLPEIDEALVRISINVTERQLTDILESAAAAWNFARATYYAQKAAEYYDYKPLYGRLAEELRAAYANWPRA